MLNNLKNKTMKNEIIYYTIFTKESWESEWQPLINPLTGKHVRSMTNAIKLVRALFDETPNHIGLAPESQMLLGNASWDNL